MRVVLFRHAERENSGSADPGLSKKGCQQALSLAKDFQTLHLPNPTRILVSPKRRSQQTFQPLSETTGKSSVIDKSLDERQTSETAGQFESRVFQFLESLSDQVGNCYICTHLDWIEEALLRIHSDTDLLQARYQTWAPGQYMLFRVEENLWHLEEFGRI